MMIQTADSHNKAASKTILQVTTTTLRIVSWRQTIVILLVVVTILTNLASTAEAVLTCDSDAFCQDMYASRDTVCLVNTKTCSNPFRRGCLRTRLGPEEWPDPRVCNSDDDKNIGDVTFAAGTTNDSFCRVPPFQYEEIRIHQANWETALLIAWIYQIILMEMADVPATVGITTNTTKFASFYAMEPTWEYSFTTYPYEALQVANQVEDCATTSQPCAHVFPEVWPGQQNEYAPLMAQGIIEPEASNGLWGKFGLHIPSFTLQEFPNLAIWYGLAGESNRELLANTFPRPTTWLEYCTEVSTTNCSSTSTEDDADSSNTTAARRFPNPDEEGLYFAQDLYTGHFRFTEKNDCIANPDTCTGHVIAPPCDWSTYLDAQLYWNDIVGLESDGPLAPSNAYSTRSMTDIWRAANATRSHVIGVWWQVDILPEEFFGTDFEFQYIIMPAPTKKCQQNRVSEQAKCGNDWNARVGNAEGACGGDVMPLRRLMATIIREQNYAAVDDMDRSPAFQLLNNLIVTTLDMRSILKQWLRMSDVDPSGYGARAAVCDWLVENLDKVMEVIPPGHPREIEKRSNYAVWYLVVTQVFGLVVGIIALVALLCCWKYRKTKTMVFAQPTFLYLILVGFCMICIGASLVGQEPSQHICTGAAWLLMLGYTIELVPVLVKTAAINRLIRSSRKQRRVNISRRVMSFKVVGVLAIVIAYLTTWTVLDPPTSIYRRTISENDITIVKVDQRCASENDSWRIVAYGYQALLLLLCAVLAFLSKDVMTQLNESKSLATMVYSHFLFVVLRGVCTVFYLFNTIAFSVTAALFSANFAFDALFAMSIYVLPKIFEARRDPPDYRRTLLATRSSRFSPRANSLAVRSDNDQDGVYGSDKLRILTCTANIGNAEPTLESLQAWIPPEGDCSLVTPLDGIETMPDGTFDVIAIGMQEATWKEKLYKKVSVSGKGFSEEEEVLNAMEERNTAQLYEMIQDILGDTYSPLSDEQRGQMRLQIWASVRVAESISNINTSGANTGIGNLLANKGGIVTTLTCAQTRMTFLSAHLAAHKGEPYYKNRCENIRSILKEARTFGLSKKLDVATSSHHMFVMGDLNFRTNFGQGNQIEEDVKRALGMIEAKDYAGLYSFDELQEGLAKADLLVGFETLPCNFPPTFKVQREGGMVYTDQRTPSYTDRILFKSAHGLSQNLKPLAYESCIDFITSDHKPVRGAFSITPNAATGGNILKGDYRLRIEQMKCFNLPAGDIDGLSDPYLMFLWDSKDLSADSRSVIDKLRHLWLGKSWPRTRYISKTLDPDWQDDFVDLVLRDCHVGSDQMLFIAAIDFDAASKDDCLGVLALNLRDLIEMQEGQAEKMVKHDRILLREGGLAGTIEFKITITRETQTKSHHRTFAEIFNRHH